MQNNTGKVGYGRPPKQHQFQKGKSGNPSGRPRQKPKVYLNEILGEELETPVTVVEGGKKKRITKMQCVIKKVLNGAMAGEKSSVKALLELIKENHPLKFKKLEEATQADYESMQELLRLAEEYARRQT